MFNTHQFLKLWLLYYNKGLIWGITFMFKVFSNCFIKEYNLMRMGVKELRSKVNKSYALGKISAGIVSSNKIYSVAKGIESVFSSTKLTRDDIPAIFALTGTVTPIPLGMGAGYTVGRIISSKPALKIAKITKKALCSTFNGINNITKIL